MIVSGQSEIHASLSNAEEVFDKLLIHLGRQIDSPRDRIKAHLY